MSNAEIRGRFVWHELMTTDPQAAGAFYSKVLPWKTQPSGMPDYTLWVSGKTQTGGLMAHSGAPPSWLVYIGTPDVDATAAAAERLGGKILKPPADIPGVGRFAVLADPQGAAFAVFKPNTPAGGDGGSPPGFSWHELATTDHQAALTFYAELFGWSRGPAHDMGPGGIYQLIEHGGTQIGGAYKLMDASKPPHWLTYITVASVDKAAAAAKAAGGRVTQEPMEVPGGSRIAHILDPQGGAFAVHELAKQAAAPSAPAEKPAAAKKAPAKKAAPKAAEAPAKPAKRAAAKAKKRPAAAKRAAKKAKAPARRKAAAKRPAARKAAGKKAARKKSARRSARKPARHR